MPKIEYEESDAVKAARAQLQQVQGQQPGEYSSKWTAPMEQIAGQIQNRPGFQYDFASDPMYQQYRQQYTRQARQGMEDAMGRAATYNGGYGSSYGQMVGQQTYNAEMQKLNDKMPELYNMALSKYQQDGADLLNRFNVLGNLENRDYGRHQDAVSSWQTDRNYWQSVADSEADRDYSRYRDNEADRKYQEEWDYGVNADRQKLARAQVDYLLSIGANVPESLIGASGYDPEYISSILARQAQLAAAEAASSGSWGGGGTTDDLVTATRKEAQKNGTTAGYQYLFDQVGVQNGAFGANKTKEAVMAQAQVRGVGMTNYYKAMLEAQKKK